jgi:hypothetical protein
MVGITDVGAEAAQESDANQNQTADSGYEGFDLSGVAFGKQHPTTAVRGTAVALRGLPPYEDSGVGNIAVIMDDPSIVTSEEPLADSVVMLSDSEGDQFKVIDTSDRATNVLEGTGVDFDGNVYYGEQSDNFGDIETVALKFGGAPRRRVGKTLDVSGATSAEALIERDDDGTITDIELDADGFPAHNGGYMEYDNDGDGTPERSRAPELRDDVEGTDVVVMIQRLDEIDPDYDGNAYWTTVFASLDDERQTELAEQYAAESDDKDPDDFITDLDGDEFIRLNPTDEFEPSESNVESTGWIQYNTFDRTDESEVLALNEARIADGQGSLYLPDGMNIDAVTPDGVDASNVTQTPDEDDWDSETDAVPVFGGGVSGGEAEEQTA